MRRFINKCRYGKEDETGRRRSTYRGKNAYIVVRGHLEDADVNGKMDLKSRMEKCGVDAFGSD
jgi:hypothetical protein